MVHGGLGKIRGKGWRGGGMVAWGEGWGYGSIGEGMGDGVA